VAERSTTADDSLPAPVHSPGPPRGRLSVANQPTHASVCPHEHAILIQAYRLPRHRLLWVVKPAVAGVGMGRHHCAARSKFPKGSAQVVNLLGRDGAGGDHL